MNCICIASHSSRIFATEAGAARKPSRRCTRITLPAWFGPSCTKFSAQSSAESPPPEFAAPGEKYLVKGEVGGYYQSNGDGYKANLSASAASDNISLRYQGALAKADNYKAGGDFKTTTATGRPGHSLPLNEVGSTAYDSRNQNLDFAWKQDNHQIEARIGYQDIPEELFPNQRMDMLDNEEKSFNLNYSGDFTWGSLKAQLYYEDLDHFMDFGPDKRFWYGDNSGPGGTGKKSVEGSPCWPLDASCAAGMPMNTESDTLGASLRADIHLSAIHLLRLGAEYQGYNLDDWWSPSGGGMWSGTFWNINDGQRDRLALFGEWEARPTAQWLTLLSLAQAQAPLESRSRAWLMVLGFLGASLFFGDSLITPAISVLSAVEGLNVAAPGLDRFVLPITIGVLFSLFLIQRHGTASVGKLFGPVMIVWFATLALLGVINITKHPDVLSLVNPLWAAGFIAEHPLIAFVTLGAACAPSG